MRLFFLVCLALAAVVTSFGPSIASTASCRSASLVGLGAKGGTEECDVLVVGSGISGSCCAFHLAKNEGVENVILAERNPVVGGNVISKSVTDDDGEFIWEEGPNSFQPTPAIVKTAFELGIADQLVLADGSLPRFVYWKGEGAGDKVRLLRQSAQSIT